MPSGWTEANCLEKKSQRIQRKFTEFVPKCVPYFSSELVAFQLLPLDHSIWSSATLKSPQLPEMYMLTDSSLLAWDHK